MSVNIYELKVLEFGISGTSITHTHGSVDSTQNENHYIWSISDRNQNRNKASDNMFVIFISFLTHEIRKPTNEISYFGNNFDRKTTYYL